MDTPLIVLSVVALGLGLTNLGCTIYVVYKLFQEKGILHALLGFFCCQLYPFIWGWLHAGRLKITDIMIFWTAVTILSMILQIIIRSLGSTLSNLPNF